jgi:hypothetical protein
MKITGIRKKPHVYADYTFVPLVLAAPAMAGFKENETATVVCRSFALTALAYSLCTKAPWGVLKIIPYRLHAGLDLASGIVALAVSAMPVVRKERNARNTFIAMGVTGLVVGTLSLLGARKK